MVIAGADVALSPITTDGVQPTSFESLYVHVAVGRFTAIVVVLYRPGSAAVQQKFFDELSNILDRVVTYQEPIYMVGDFSIRLDHLDNQYADQLHLLADCYGLVLHITGPTHKLGGTFDAVISHSVTGCPSCLAVEDVGLSDHFLLHWEASTTRAAVPTTSICCRPSHRLEIEQLRSELLASRLCRLNDWPSDVDSLAALYNDELNCLLDHIYQCGSSSVDSGRQTRGFTHSAAMQSVVHVASSAPTPVALVNQRLDYGNSTLVGIPAYLMHRLQSALNAAARLIFHLRHSDHITDALVS